MWRTLRKFICICSQLPEERVQGLDMRDLNIYLQFREFIGVGERDRGAQELIMCSDVVIVAKTNTNQTFRDQ